MQSADVLRNGAPPRHRQRQEQRVQPRVVEPFTDVLASREDDAALTRRNGRHSFAHDLPLLLAHSAAEHHNVKHIPGEPGLESVEVLVALRQDER